MNVWPPIVSVAVRAAVAFTATVKPTVPGPLPVAGVTVTHVALLPAVQLHPADVVTLTAPLPPVAATLWLLLPNTYVHPATAAA